MLSPDEHIVTAGGRMTAGRRITCPASRDAIDENSRRARRHDRAAVCTCAMPFNGISDSHLGRTIDEYVLGSID